MLQVDLHQAVERVHMAPELQEERLAAAGLEVLAPAALAAREAYQSKSTPPASPTDQ